MTFLRFSFIWIFLLTIRGIVAQDADNTHYFLPVIKYHSEIPTPEQFFGFATGDWHHSPDQLVSYFKTLSEKSTRMKWIEYGRTHENRPLIVGIFSHEDNLKNLDDIKAQHQKLHRRQESGQVNTDNLPAVIYQGYSIHGNEQSGAHAALWVAYYLTAGQSDEVERLIKNTIILIDPCLNPDGSQRFTTWVNSHKSSTLVSDPASREFSEVWPGGRYNHYWFDLNRDWLLLVHPESRARIQMFQEWCPDVVGDYHEMGTQSTYFFQPGVPSRNNPLTPDINFQLTEKIGRYHARALDSIGSLYFTKSNFDDFYYGKGSTYPEATGTIGILFEQASSRGHLQESIYGPRSFRSTIRNQVVTSLSTQNGVLSLKKDILEYKKNFYAHVSAMTGKNDPHAYIYTDKDKVKLRLFTELLLRHQIEVYRNSSEVRIDGIIFRPDESFIVPLKQNQPVLARTMFEEVKNFQDSLFYDVSGWTVAHGYGIDVKPWNHFKSHGQKVTYKDLLLSFSPLSESYAYVIPAGQYHLHRAAYHCQKQGFQLLYTQTDFTHAGMSIGAGSLIIPAETPGADKTAIIETLNHLSNTYPLEVIEMKNGNDIQEVSLGHPLVKPLNQPKIAFFAGESVTPQNTGEVWHHLDMQLNIPATMIDVAHMSSTELQRYNTLVMPQGSYRSWTENEADIIKNWVRQGHTLIVIGQAGQWLQRNNITSLKPRKKNEADQKADFRYDQKTSILGARRLGGSIFKLKTDSSHPLFYGVNSGSFHIVKRGTDLFEPTANPTATPARYASEYLASGYVPRDIQKIIPGSAAITVHAMGSGRIIFFQDDILFRGYWKNGEKVFNNALFYGIDIASHSVSEE